MNRIPSRYRKLKAWLKWFIVYVPLGLFAFITAPFVCLVVFPLSFLGRFNPLHWILWFWMDDEIYNKNTSADWRAYKKGNFFRWYLWHGFRNTMWNVKRLLRPKVARENCITNNEVIVEVVEDTLMRNGQKISIYGKCLEMAGLKWITKDGEEGWHVFSGEKISKTYSNINTAKLWYEAHGHLYPRFSSVEPIRVFGKRYWRYYAIGVSDKRYLFNFKMYKYQKMY